MPKWNDLPQRRKALRLKGFDYTNPGFVYFVTLCVRRPLAPFTEPAFAAEVVRSLLKLREQQGIRLYCYCLMPDHLHLALSPSARSGSVSKVLQGFKSYTTRVAWRYGITGRLWQRSFYDHIARQDEDLVRICEYILANPVRKGLAGEPREWKYSGMVDPLPP